MALAFGICFQCDVYTDLRTVQLEDNTWGYKCPYNHVETKSGKPAKEKK